MKVADDPKSTKNAVCVTTLSERSEGWNRVLARDPSAGLRELTEAWNRIVARYEEDEDDEEDEEGEKDEKDFLPDPDFNRILGDHLVLKS